MHQIFVLLIVLGRQSKMFVRRRITPWWDTVQGIATFALKEFTDLLFLDSYCESSRFLHRSVSRCSPRKVALEKNPN